MKSFLTKLIDGYEDTKLGKHFVSLSYSGSVTSKGKRLKTKKVHRTDEKISSFFSATRSTCYGAFFISLGLSVLLFYFLNEYAGAYAGSNFVTLTIGAVCSVISIPMLLSDKPLHRMLSESRILDYIFFEFFCMKRAWSPDDQRGAPTILGVVLGILVAGVGIFVPVGNVVLALGVALLIYIAFSSPEFPYLLSLLLVPYSTYIPYSEFVLSFLSILATLAFIRKTVSGKRVLHTEQYDILLFIMLTLICIYANLTSGSLHFSSYFIIVSLFAGYMLSSNVITNRRLADSVSNGLVVATLPLAVYHVVICVIAMARGAQMPALSDEFVASAVASAVLSLRLIRHSVGFAKLAYGALLVLYTVSVGMTMLLVCALALLFGIASAVVYRMGRYAMPAMSVLFLALSLLHLLPEWVKAQVYPILGVDSPTLVEAMLSSPVGMSIFALAMLIFIVRIRHRVLYSAYFEGTHLTSISGGYAGAMLALLVMLCLRSSMISTFSLYLLISVFGMGSAALRVAKTESDNAELYFEDSKNIDSSTVNIVIH